MKKQQEYERAMPFTKMVQLTTPFDEHQTGKLLPAKFLLPATHAHGTVHPV